MKPSEKCAKLIADITALEAMSITAADTSLIIQAAKAASAFALYDSHNIYVTVFHNGTRKNPWMFEIRRNGMLRGAFEGIENGYETREKAEQQAFEVADSMLDGTFEIRFTS